MAADPLPQSTNNQITLFPIAILRWLNDWPDSGSRIEWLRNLALFARTRFIWQDHVEHANEVYFEGEASQEEVEEFLLDDPSWHSPSEDCGLKHYEKESDVFTWLYGVCTRYYPSPALYEQVREVYDSLVPSHTSGSMTVGLPLRVFYWNLSWNELVLLCAVAAALGAQKKGRAPVKVIRRNWLQALAAGYNKVSDVPSGVRLIHTNTVTSATERLKELKLIHRRYDGLGRRNTWYALEWRLTEEEFEAYVRRRVVGRAVSRVEGQRERKQESKEWADSIKAEIARNAGQSS